MSCGSDVPLKTLFFMSLDKQVCFSLHFYAYLANPRVALYNIYLVLSKTIFSTYKHLKYLHFETH